MDHFSECKVWKKTDVIDIPYMPFVKEEIVKEKIINDSAKYIKKIQNISYREVRTDESIGNERRFLFYRADTLIGLDISTLDASAFSYLDQFFFLMKMYPLVLINSYAVTEDSLKRIALHSYCTEHHYILPTFGPMPFLDKALSGDYYGDKIVKLIKGEVDKIELSDFPKLDKNNTMEELKVRFPQFEIEANEVFFKPQITWLGVPNRKIVNLLNNLFNNNIETFNLKEYCKKFDIKEDELKHYIDKSMLFYQLSDEAILFRMQRKNVYWGFICNLAEQFEREIIERDAIKYDIRIDEEIGTIKRIDEKIYHKLGNLFSKCDAFAYKLFSNIKRILDKNFYTEILVVDNGNMDSILAMLQRIGWKDNVCEILDYYGTAVKIPTIDYRKLENKNVLIIIDVINTGKLIKSVVDVIKEIGCKKIGIFSFIVNQEYSISTLKSDDSIEFSYLTEKKLSNIEDILDKEYSKRFCHDRDLNFRLLWGGIKNDLVLARHDKPITTYLDGFRNVQDFCEYRFNFNLNLDRYSYAYQKIKRFIIGKDVLCILNTMVNLKELVERIIQTEQIRGIDIIEIEEKDIGLAKKILQFKDKNVLFFIPNQYVNTCEESLKRFININIIQKAEFLDIVELETYYLDTYKMEVEERLKYSYIFSTKLKKISGVKENPEFNFWTNYQHIV